MASMSITLKMKKKGCSYLPMSLLIAVNQGL